MREEKDKHRKFHFSPVNLTTSNTCERKHFNFYMQFCVSVHILSHPGHDPSGIHNLFGWCESGQGKTCWFESCPCRSSEGARDLFNIKAKIVEGQAIWKCDPCPSAVTLSCTVGTL